jgi:Zn-dependent protease with chaperone function
MSYPQDPEKTAYRLELEQTVHAHVAQLSAETGLQEPAIDVVPVLKGQKARINAQSRMPAGVPTITITERAIQELPHRVLRFLLAHEFGHFAHWDFRHKAPRRMFESLLLGVAIFVLGVLLATTGTGNSVPGVVMLWAGVALLLAAPVILQTCCRADEYRVDVFAARLTGDLAAARRYFAALEQDQRRVLSHPWSSHPSVPDRFAAVVKVLDRNNEHERTS